MCAANVGSQSRSLRFGAPGNSAEVNERFVSIRPLGIYSGGLLRVSGGSNAIVSPLVCEIGDGTYQVRIETTVDVTLSVPFASSTPYIVLRWSYTGDTTDYAEILAVATPTLPNDVVVGMCVYTAGSLTGFDYGTPGVAAYPRSVPNTHDLCLKVVPSFGTTLKALVMPGYAQGQTASYFVPMQETSALVAPASLSKVYLIVLSDAGVISVDSTGTEAATPAAPSYAGRMVLAEITLAPAATVIVASNIKDVRPFITSHPPVVDAVTLTTNATGQLKQVDPVYLIARTIGAQLSNLNVWTLCSTILDPKVFSGLTMTAGVLTLPANRLYKISYSIVFGLAGATSTPEYQARLHVLTGDVSWYLGDDEYNVSMQKTKLSSYFPNQPATLSGTFLILPASSTTIQLEVKTRAADGAYGQVLYATLSAWAD